MADAPNPRPSAEKDVARRCEGTCDYCRPDAWHECTRLAGHEGYHSCTGYGGSDA